MIKIENISVSDNIALCLWFNKSNTYECMLFGKVDDIREIIGNYQTTQKDTERIKRSFGSIIIDGLQIADSDEYAELKENCDKLQSILKIGKGKTAYAEIATELFRLYNDTDNPLMKYLFLKIWSVFLGLHKERCDKTYVNNKRIGGIYAGKFNDFINTLLHPIEKKIVSLDELADCMGNADVSLILQEKSLISCYTCTDTLIPLYIKTLEQMNGRCVRSCSVCNAYFIANRANENICGDGCKAKRQIEYNQKHREKVEDDYYEREFERNRQAYDNFRKKFRKAGANYSPEFIEKYETAKREFLRVGNIKRKQRKNGLLTDKTFMTWLKDEVDKRWRLEMESDEGE
jgi:hypothetical protein